MKLSSGVRYTGRLRPTAMLSYRLVTFSGDSAGVTTAVPLMS
jgi:hypothetical protein